MNLSISTYIKSPLVVILSAATFFGIALAQDEPQLVAETGEKPTSGSDVAVVPDVAKKPDEVKKTDEVKKPDVAEAPEEAKNPEEAKKPEPVKESPNGGADEAVAPTDGKTDAKRAKPVNSESIRVFGWVEWCVISDEKLTMKARLDTGAKTSSLHAEDIELFERDGAKWVKFTTVSNEEKRVMIESPLKRIARIRKAGSDKLDERYVVDLDFAIDGVQRRGEFTLSERDHMNYPVLVGRNLIGEFGLIDARRSFIAEENIEL